MQGLLFREQEAGYLVGYAAGMWAKTHNGKAVGSVGGLKIPPVDRYIAGFQYGAKKADPGIKTLNSYSNDFVKQNEVQRGRAEPDRRARSSSSRSPASAVSASSTRRTRRACSASASTPTRGTSARG